MVAAALADALTNPTAVVESLHDATDSIEAYTRKVSNHFVKLFEHHDAFRQIPSLNIENPPETFQNGSLVAFRAMVQDTSLSPELYLVRLPDGRYGGWGVADNAPYDGNYNDLGECTVVWAVSIPGESSWCLHETKSLYQSLKPGDKPQAKTTRPHKCPVPNIPAIAAQIKIYDPRWADDLKASDICTFVGILTQESIHGPFDSTPPETVPTLHVLFLRKTPTTIIPRKYPDSSLSRIKKLRDELLTWIADEALGGDKAAAEWVLLAALSRIQSRTPPVLPPSITLSSFPAHSSKATPTLFHVLSLVFPMVNILPFSLDTLNNTAFSPESKDGDEDLRSGWLQVPKGSIYLVNETAIAEGELRNRGVQNLVALQNMMSRQSLDYVFPYSRFPFETDVSFLVLAVGRKSAFFQTSVNVPLKPTDRDCDLYKSSEQIRMPSDDVLSSWRSLVGGSKIGKVAIDETTVQYIEEDFVKERKASASGKGDENSITSDDLALRMIVARLLALSFHESHVTKDIWEMAKEMEVRRKVLIS